VGAKESLEGRKRMTIEGLEIEKKDHVALVRILGLLGESHGMTQRAIEVSERLGMLRFHGDIRVLILEEKGKGAFCFGEEILAKIPQVISSEGRTFPSIAEAISRIEVPVIAGVEGDAVGPGLEWILACDMRIGSETSRFGLPQGHAGVIPSDGGTQRLARLVGKGKALEMIFTGEWINAEEALRIGLVNRVVPKGDVSKVAMELAKDLISKSPFSTKYAKEAICKGMELSLDQGLRLEADLYFLLHTTKDRTEGIRAFQERRKAHFEGR
jgi:enoyl-CoA hydratase/carnithine racemase